MLNSQIIKFFIVCISLLSAAASTAQITTQKGSAAPPSAPAALDAFLDQAVTPALFVIRVDYVLRENKKREPQDFGRDTLPYFGRVHGLAVVSDGRYWFDPRLLEPWLHADSTSYYDVKDEDLYKPVVKQIQFRTIHGQKFESYAFHADSVAAPSKSIASLPMAEPMPGLTPVILQSDSSTLLLLFFAESAQRMEYTDTAAVKMDVANTPVSFNEEGNGSYKLPLIARLRPPMGGLLCSVEASTGRIHFKFAGILAPPTGKSGDMELLVPPYGIAADPTAPPPPTKPVLTPINKDKASPNSNKTTPKGGGNVKPIQKQKKD